MVRSDGGSPEPLKLPRTEPRLLLAQRTRDVRLLRSFRPATSEAINSSGVIATVSERRADAGSCIGSLDSGTMSPPEELQ